MKPTVYLETTIIGYLAMRVSGMLRVAANQQTTRDWWDGHRHGFDLFVSRFVVDECTDGDPAAAEERLAYLQGIPLLEISDDVNSLAVRRVVQSLQPRTVPRRKQVGKPELARVSVFGLLRELQMSSYSR